jgi:hypothetical protein
MKKILLLLAVSAFTFIGCKKEKKKTTKEILTSKTWGAGSAKINGNVVKFDDCELDNTVKFSTDGIVTEDPGTVKCSPSESISTSDYKLSSDEKTLTFLDGGISVDWTIIEINDTKFVITYLDGTDLGELTYIAK